MYNKNSIKKTILKCDKCDRDFERKNDAIELYKEKCDNKTLCKYCYGKLNKQRKKDNINPLAKENGNFTQKGNPCYTVTCKYCQSDFEVTYTHREREFCSKSCQVKGSDRISIKRKSLCKVCNTEFKHYGERPFCSNDCNAKYMSQMRLGENNPNWIPREELEKSECPTCSVVFSYARSGLHKGQKRLFCSLKCSKVKAGGRWINDNEKEKYIVDSNNFDIYKAYISNPYPIEWNDELKEKVKQRDNYCCQLCESPQKLEIHHKDDNKQNCSIDNLITLCRKCHNLTKHNREFWQQVFVGLGSNSKIVKKGWGLEIHIVNNNKYCLKYLIFFKGKKFSLHKHYLKQELWLCTWGEFECYLKKDNIEDYFIFKKGDKIEIMPGVEHQLQAITNCIITEVSTTDYPEDSIRIEKGD